MKRSFPTIEAAIAFAMVVLAALTACGGGAESTAPDAMDAEAQASAERPAGDASGGSVDMSRSDSYAEAKSAAEAALDKAVALEYAWTTSPQLMDDAEKAWAAGDEAKAIELADEARIQAELAIVQAERQAVAWKENIIGNPDDQ